MKPVMQTKRGGVNAPPEQRGDCFDACLASLLEVPLEDVRVPHDDQWWDHAVAAVGRHGHVIFEPYRLDLLPEGTEPYTAPVLGEWIGNAYWIAAVPSHNLPGERHVIVMRGADVAHDPGLGSPYTPGPLGEDVPVFNAMLLLPKAPEAADVSDLVRSRTATLPPPATAAGRSTPSDDGDDLVHICATHSDARDQAAANAACAAGVGCVSYCGRDLTSVDLLPDDYDAGPRDCVVCEDLWRTA